jgi:hypothetical protein
MFACLKTILNDTRHGKHHIDLIDIIQRKTTHSVWCICVLYFMTRHLVPSLPGHHFLVFHLLEYLCYKHHATFKKKQLWQTLCIYGIVFYDNTSGSQPSRTSCSLVKILVYFCDKHLTGLKKKTVTRNSFLLAWHWGKVRKLYIHVTWKTKSGSVLKLTHV